jgi:prepilin-type N-terminal cleavage/methylation domain-containing protein
MGQKIMLKGLALTNQEGFTLIELISTMIILSVVASVAIKKLDFISGTAADKVLQQGVGELNARENLTWIDMKLSSTNWTNDGDVYSAMDTNLGSDFIWTSGPNASGGTLSFRDQSTALNRIPSTFNSAGSWN